MSAAAILGASWPQARAAEALLALARAAGHAPRGGEVALASDEGPGTLGARLESEAEARGLELEPVEAPYADAGRLVTGSAPALLCVEDAGGEVRLLALVRSGRRARLLAPDGGTVTCPSSELLALLCGAQEGVLDALVTRVLDEADLRGVRRDRARRALIAEHLGAVPVGGAWILRPPPGGPFLHAMRRAGLARLAVGVVLAGFGASALGLGSWIPFGRGVLSGSFEPAWIAAWALLVLATLPLRWLEGWLQSLFGLRFGILLRRRLMAGATRLEPDAMRGEGAGSLLGRVLDSEALEALLLGGGFVLIGAAIDVALASWVLSHGPTPVLSQALFAGLALLSVVLGLAHWRRARRQADARLAMTHDLVERMQGQRTRVVQEPSERWHLEEDALLQGYLDRSRELDRSMLVLYVLVSSAWLVGGAAVLGGALVAGSLSTMELALALGALLLGQQALSRWSSGFVQLAACAVAWRQVRPVFHAAARPEDAGLPRATLRPAEPSVEGEAPPLLAARDLCFRHAGRERDALTNASFEVASGEAVLLEGPSGGGKSTLVSLISGWRSPRSGSLLLEGLDRDSQGAARWRRKVAAAPQFHENHVFTGTMAFNLLLAAPPDTGGAPGSELTAEWRENERARVVCEELGLGPLLARMPSGLRQVLGETGWQLSHGERSRLFLARALLADARLVVLDESLAALDPETARGVLGCVRRRAESLLVVAHP